MKFLKNTATDLLTNSARFIKKAPSAPEHGSNFEEINSVVFKKTTGELKNLKKECGATGQWSTETQNTLAGKIEKEEGGNLSHIVNSGDTLGAIIKGLAGKLDYSRPVVYRSTRITDSARTRWNEKSTCFDIPEDLGANKDQLFSLGVVNLIYPGQIVTIRNGVIYIEDGGGVVPPVVKTPDPISVIPKPEIIDPIVEKPIVKTIPTGEGCFSEQVGDDSPCEEFTAKEIWGGFKNEDLAMEYFEKISDGSEKSLKDAREAYRTLYGDPETMENVERKGVYVVLEEYLNPGLWDGVGGIAGGLKELVNDDSFAEALDDAGYKESEIKKLNTELLKTSKQGGVMEANLAKLKNQDAGAGKDFLRRLAVGAAVGTAVALAFNIPITLPILLVGAPLFKFKGGVKSFSQYPDVNTVYKQFTNPNTSAEDLQKIGTLETPKTYIEIQQNALVLADMALFSAHDVVDSDATLVLGPNPKRGEKAKLSKEYQEEHENLKENSDIVEKKIKKILSELIINNSELTKGAKKEALASIESDIFEFEDGSWWFLKLDDLWRNTDKDKYEDTVSAGTQAFSAKNRNTAYTKAMTSLVDKFNTEATELLGSVWEKDLTMETLNESLKNGHKFYLGSLGEVSGRDYTRDLSIKFTPRKASQADASGANGTWEMYLEEKNGEESEVVHVSQFDYKQAIALLEKPKLTEQDLQLLGYDPKQKLTGAEKKTMVKQLRKAIPILGQLAQINETKDLMNLSAQYAKRENAAAKLVNDFVPRMSNDGAETEGATQYRVAVTAKLAKFQTWERFQEVAKDSFSPKIQEKIKLVYKNRSGEAMDELVKDPAFQEEMACLTQKMKALDGYLKLTDLTECANYMKKHIYLSGMVAGKESKYHTISFGDAYLGVLAAKGLRTTELVKFRDIINSTADQGGGGTESITYGPWLEKAVPKWELSGLLKRIDFRKAIVAISGGRVTNAYIDSLMNDPVQGQHWEK